jgi:hypothetical protein
MDAVRAEHRIVTRMFFPEPREPLFDLGAGVNAVVDIGEPAYQLTDGTVVTL